jgi:hypothetical protein
MVEIAEKKGHKKIKFFDIEAAWKCFEDERDEYRKILNKFTSMDNFEKMGEAILDELPVKVENIHASYNKKLVDIINTKKEYNIREARTLYVALESMRLGKSQYGFVDSLDEYESTSKEIEKMLTNLMNDPVYNDIKKADDIYKTQKNIKKVQPVQKTITKVTSFMYQHSKLCIGAVIAAVAAISFGPNIVSYYKSES